MLSQHADEEAPSLVALTPAQAEDERLAGRGSVAWAGAGEVAM
jgi:hypothetical protein